MNSKWKKYGLWLFAFLLGSVGGFLRPDVTQSTLSPLGIIVGLGFLFYSRNNANKKDTTSIIDWFIILQMLLYFIIGAALSMTIALFITRN